MQVKTFKTNTAIISLLIVGAILSRLIPHPTNFAPMMAIGLFGGALFQNKKWAYIIPILSIWLSDLLILNIVYAAYYPTFTWFYEGFYWQYAIYLLVPFLASILFKKTITPGKVLVSGLATGILFFIVSNFGVWFSSQMYAPNASGLWLCYIKGLPFLKGTLLGNAVYSAALFSTYYFVEKQIPTLKTITKFQLRWI